MAAGAFLALTVLVLLPPSGPVREPGRDAARRRAEERLREIREKEKELAAPPPSAAPDPAADRRRQEERESLKAERERIEREMREYVDRTRKPEAPVAAPAREPERTPPPVPPAAPPTPETKVTVAMLREAAGDVTVVTDSVRARAAAGQPLLAGQGLETGGADARAVVEYADRTRLELGGSDPVRVEFGREKRKKISVLRGIVTAVVAKQPADEPMTFLTPQGEATVLGTTLRLLVDETSTRLEVTEGRVRLKRLSDGKTVDVVSGHFAVASAGLEPVAQALPVNEIVLLPATAKLVGTEWARVSDDQASSGKALEAPAVRLFDQSLSLLKRNGLGYAEFTFKVDADKTYQVWVRGRCTAAKDRELHDGVAIEFLDGKPSDQFVIPDVPGGSERVYLSGFGSRAGYTWVCRAGDFFERTPPVSVRFARSGVQQLRLYGVETPLRIDALWLSATQKTRPADDQRGPATK